MKSMRPFELRPLMIAYNLFLVVLNFYMCTQVFSYVAKYGDVSIVRISHLKHVTLLYTFIVHFHNKRSELHLHL